MGVPVPLKSGMVGLSLQSFTPAHSTRGCKRIYALSLTQSRQNSVEKETRMNSLLCCEPTLRKAQRAAWVCFNRAHHKLAREGHNF